MHRLVLILFASLALAAAAFGQRSDAGSNDIDGSRAALAAALAERRAAESRGERLEAQAEAAQNAATRAANTAAALAARIQQSEAGIAAATTRIAMIDKERAGLREELGREQQPVVRLTAALQQFSRRPVALSMLQPGSIKDVVYLRAILHDTVPQVRARTSGLRAQIARSRELRREALAAAQVLREEEQELGERRAQMTAIETRQRLAAQRADGAARREGDRALVLGEEALDLDALIGELDRAAALRASLARLPGPRLRPARPGDASASANAAAPLAQSTDRRAPAPYILPVAGRVVSGFGVPAAAGVTQGLTLAPMVEAQVVAPAAGRVAFAGPYRGYGQIVIIAHAGGWTSLITGLARIDVAVGDELLGGAPLGRAAAQRPSISLELRRNGTTVNPLEFAS